MKNKYPMKKRKINNKKTNNKFNLFLLKFFTIILLFSLLSVAVKKDSNVRDIIFKNVYKNNFSFAYFKNIYNKNIGNIIPFQNIFREKKVFNEKLEYNSLSKYNKGVKLTLNDNYTIPILKSGIVTFVGKKDTLGKTIIIQGSDGIDIWYGNLSNTNVKLYDYVEQNDIVGEAKNNKLYLMFQKDGVEIDYNKVLK